MRRIIGLLAAVLTLVIQAPPLQFPAHCSRNFCWRSPSSWAPGTSPSQAALYARFCAHPFTILALGRTCFGADFHLRSSTIAKLTPPRSSSV